MFASLQGKMLSKKWITNLLIEVGHQEHRSGLGRTGEPESSSVHGVETGSRVESGKTEGHSSWKEREEL
jgi:hypothetical protein